MRLLENNYTILLSLGLSTWSFPVGSLSDYVSMLFSSFDDMLSDCLLTVVKAARSHFSCYSHDNVWDWNLKSQNLLSYDKFWSLITKISTWIPLFFLFGFLLFKKYNWRGALSRVLALILLAVFITFLTDQVKDVVGRLRPNNNDAINDFIRVLRSPRDYSFFSGHASSSFSITIW